jgi:hypothetical protein
MSSERKINKGKDGEEGRMICVIGRKIRCLA